MAQKMTTVGEIREALEECEDGMPVFSVADSGELKDLFIYGHKKPISAGFAADTEMVVVFESDSSHWEFNL